MTTSRHSDGARELGIVGTGRVAKSLGVLLNRRGFQIAAVAGRSVESAKETARFVGSTEAAVISDLPRYASRILIAVSDDSIAPVAQALAQGNLRSGIVLHTAAAGGPEALACLREEDNSVGVLHPLQTIPNAARGIETLPGATFAYAGDEAAIAWAGTLIAALGGKPLAIPSPQWHLYHAAAVFASNYHLTLIDAALELMQGAGLARGAALDALRPIIRATTENVLSSGPELALTGPILRGDAATVRKHFRALERCLPETKNLYAAAGLRTVALAMRSGLSSEAAREITEALTGTSDQPSAGRSAGTAATSRRATSDADRLSRSEGGADSQSAASPTLRDAWFKGDS